MSAAVVVRAELRGDLATLTLRSGCCGTKRTHNVCLRSDQTQEEHVAELTRRYPAAEIVTTKAD